MAHVIFKILLMVFLCFFFITFVAKDAIASFFTDETILDENCYSSSDSEYLCDEVSIFPEESPMTSICNLIQYMYNVISTVWNLFMYFGCVTWKIVSFNPCLSFMMGIAFTFLFLVKAPKSLSLVANLLGTVKRDDQGMEDEKSDTDASDVENELVSQESLVEELSKADDTGKPESHTQQHEASSIGTNENANNEDYASISSAGTRKERTSSAGTRKERTSSAGTSKKEAARAARVSRKKRKKSRNDKLMKDLLSIKELEEKLEKQTTELFNGVAGLRNEVAEIRDNASKRKNEFYLQLENAVNQIRAQGNEFRNKSEDYTKVIEKLESDLIRKSTSSENLQQQLNVFPTEEDVVKWLHSSLCSLVDKDLYTSQTPHERRCFTVISRSPLAQKVSSKFSEMVVTLDSN